MISSQLQTFALLLSFTGLSSVVHGRIGTAEVDIGFTLPSSGRDPFGFHQQPDVIVGRTRKLSVSSRQLYGSQWSWTNLFFHIGLCNASKCHTRGFGPCGCPDCSKNHPVGWQNGYCDSYDSSSTSDGSSSSSGSSGNTNDAKALYDGTSDNTGNGPNATRKSYLWMWMAGAGLALVAAGTAFVMRKRTANALATSKGVVAAASKVDTSTSSNYMLMGAAGVSAAIAAAMARLGLKSNDDSSSTSGSSDGMVSKRMSLMKNAEELPRVDDASVTPSFIEVRSSTRGLGTETFLEDLNGMEVQGPYRPSSNYAV